MLHCLLFLRFVHFTWGGERKIRVLMKKVFFSLGPKRLQAGVTDTRINFTIMFTMNLFESVSLFLDFEIKVYMAIFH